MTHRMSDCSHEVEGRSTWSGWSPAALPENVVGKRFFTRQCMACGLLEQVPFMAREQCDSDCTFC